TSKPRTTPRTWTSDRRSPSRTTASSTVTTGSHVLSNDDRAAPIRGRPARNSEIATIVGMRAIAKPTAQPCAVTGSASSPVNAAMMQNAIDATDTMTAHAPTVGTEHISLSYSRMYYDMLVL